ncbi:hypothetical protein SP8_0029 [Escherichia phage vB_EcoS_SP8]|nr:hypothetical protein SP8_0029 [Escherichia phage vB_EcoS_SP8]
MDKEEIYQFLRNYTGKENRFQVAAKEFNIGLSTAYKIYHIYGRLIRPQLLIVMVYWL